MAARMAFYKVAGSFYPPLKILQCSQYKNTSSASVHLEGNVQSLQDPG